MEREQIRDLRRIQKTEPEGTDLVSLRHILKPIGQRVLQKLAKNDTIRKPSGHIKEHNQLKYVCRQLYYECKALELKHAQLVCSCQRTALAATPFLDFLDFALAYGFWIRDVKLTGNVIGYPNLYLEPIDRLLTIARFCRENPHAVVKYIFHDFEFPTPKKHSRNYLFLEYVIFLKMALRDEKCYTKLLRGASFHEHLLAKSKAASDKWRQNRSVKELVIPNLIFLPHNGLGKKELEHLYWTIGHKNFNPPWKAHCNVPLFIAALRSLLKDGI
jgi:hypothetical protein